ncbi:alpha/beta hydrolase family protein [Nocardia fusca]|uniref:alpha/beta hydrolase family protein n=1 Tax=Nocardia fusca TaxID=941183 RepID=UPI000A775A53|nr:hypothetical protein [Nocardia fusca]
MDITFTRGDGTTTTGTVHAPAGATGRPGVVLVHGSGKGRSAHYDLTADAFARAGIVALAYGKRTEGYTPAHRDYSLLADDALAGLAALRSRPEVDPARVGLWGLSEGGWVAPARRFAVGRRGIPDHDRRELGPAGRAAGMGERDQVRRGGRA